MRWSAAEIQQLEPILDEVCGAAEILGEERVLVLCSAAGDMAFRLANKLTCGQIIGAELDASLVEAARLAAAKRGVSGRVEFCPTEKTWLPFHENAFDALVSEFIVFPSPRPTEIGQPEMARVLHPGGRMVITDVIAPRPVPAEMRAELRKIGLDYLCEATKADFRAWMEAAGLCDVVVKDLTAAVKAVWERRAATDTDEDHKKAYGLLLEESPVRLGEGLFYILVRGVKPDG